MRVKARLNIGTSDVKPGMLAGEERELSEAVAVRLVRTGAAIHIPSLEGETAPPDEPKAKKTGAK